MISRLLDYKENFARFLRMNKSSLKFDVIDECIKLMKPVDLTKKSQVQFDDFLKRNKEIQFLAK